MATSKKCNYYKRHITAVIMLIFMYTTNAEVYNDTITIEPTITTRTHSNIFTKSIEIDNFKNNFKNSVELITNDPHNLDLIKNISVNSENRTFVIKNTSDSSVTDTIPVLFNSIQTTTDSSAITCANHTLLDPSQQPSMTVGQGKLKKCCPLGMNYKMENQTHECVLENVPFDIEVIVATFYEDCIEDMEENVTLTYQIGHPCLGKEAFIYNRDYGDNLYIIQNGSLLRIDEDFKSFDIFDNYCLDMDRDTKLITAVVCNQSMIPMEYVSRAQSYIYAICMLTSVPCLIVTAFFYLSIAQLRDLHGKSLACHCICLALGFFILSVAQIRASVTQTIGFVIQYFILACFLWLAVMCVDICVQVWYYIPRNKQNTAIRNFFRFIFYSILCQGLPLILVILSASKELPGMPSYYLKGITEATRSSQEYFIPPISTTLFVCFLLEIISFFGFQKLDPIAARYYIYKKKKENENIKIDLELINIDHYESVKRLAKSTAYLYITMTINWIFEIISFYVHSSDASLFVVFDMMNALQGILIFIIFVCLPEPLHIIKRWWMDRGSLDLATANVTELEVLNNGNARN